MRRTGRRKPLTNRDKRRRRAWIYRFGALGVVLILVWIVSSFFMKKSDANLNTNSMKTDIDVQLLTVNPFSRPGKELKKVKGIVIHYTANPGTTAQNNRDYFEGLKDSQSTKASSHFIVGLEGEVVQCIPSSEVAYASNDRNDDTIAVECCHPGEDGKFTEQTRQKLIELVADLCQKFDLDSNDIIRHYDVTGKNCPKYYVEQENEWVRLKKDIENYRKSH